MSTATPTAPTATPTATPTGTQASLSSRVAVRWYQLAVIVLGLAFAAVTALAIYFAVNHSTATASSTGTAGTAGTAEPTPFNEDPCYKTRVPC